MLHVLVIDDDRAIRGVMRSMLENAGYVVIDTPDGHDAMALLQKDSIDLVVVDIFMPKKDGFEMIRDLKSLDRKPKILAISGGGSGDRPDLISAALLLGADRVLLKPFAQETFLQMVKELLPGCHEETEVRPHVPVIDHRKYKRFAVSFPVAFWREQTDGVGTVIDISREGCRVVSNQSLLRGDYLRMAISIDACNKPLLIDLAVIRWSRNGEFGVELIRMDPDDQARWRNRIHECEQALPPLCREIEEPSEGS